MDENLIYELFGENELSDDYLTLLKNYQMTRICGIMIVFMGSMIIVSMLI